MNLTVKLAGIIFKNPVTVASGTFGHSKEYYTLDEVKRLGAIIPKTVTLHPQVGNPPPRIYETPSGMINAIGIENAGIDGFIEHQLPLLKSTGVPLIISILGHGEDQFAAIIEKLNEQDCITAVELNLSCPNLKHKLLVAQDPAATKHLVSRIKALSQFPIIAKLSPNVTDIAEIAVAAEEGGADGLSLVNTFSAMAIDIKKRTSRIGNFTGGLSGPAIRPIALYMVQRVVSRVKIPVIGIGGIMTASDALEFLIAGSTMVAIGSANFVNPRAPIDVLEGIEAFMKDNKINDVREIIGSLKK
ncbi:MAG: dihydroorotate dehydrogenase [Candidatus Omnitrophica bacterium]|nr:dihydroorotate dehydrogenase [Candidatus Omnitrophota bacterium]